MSALLSAMSRARCLSVLIVPAPMPSSTYGLPHVHAIYVALGLSDGDRRLVPSGAIHGSSDENTTLVEHTKSEVGG